MMEIEETISSQMLPVNSRAMLYRLLEILSEEKTNCLEDIREDCRVKAVMLLLMGQVFGQLATISLCDLYNELIGTEVF